MIRWNKETPPSITHVQCNGPGCDEEFRFEHPGITRSREDARGMLALYGWLCARGSGWILKDYCPTCAPDAPRAYCEDCGRVEGSKRRQGVGYAGESAEVTVTLERVARGALLCTYCRGARTKHRKTVHRLLLGRS